MNTIESNVIQLFPSSHSVPSDNDQMDPEIQDEEFSPIEQYEQSVENGQNVQEIQKTGPSRMTDLYSVKNVENLLGISANRLRYWARTGLVTPSGKRGQKRYYTFQDLVALRAAVGLFRSGLTAQHIRRSLDSLKKRLPNRASPLAELRLSREGGAIIVRDENKRFEAETGQILLDFDVSQLEKKVVELIQPRQKPGTEQRQQAFDAYLEGCRFETSPDSIDRAETAYRKAIELDPKLACAYTNLGNIRYRSGAVDDARVLYQKAAELEPEQPEAHYNLAFLTYEDGELTEAIKLFKNSLKLDPDFADAHFNLGVALMEVGLESEARVHFSAYLELHPEGPWSDLARSFF